ncbi:heme exporter protein CcmD [Endozoicomonas ascidiicola]|uniref:heme exporter protein CcmD n=1 Tax=Endozoicomonas ascidiicola TaxID=1698521 RepID=UPI000B237729|nr:heme exporter protein CcmD [Endozoicomonas ascidiicola]
MLYFENWSEFLAMDGHGFYVWSAYAVGLLVVIYNVLSPMMAKRKVIASIRRQERLAKGVGKMSSITESSLLQDGRGAQ